MAADSQPHSIVPPHLAAAVEKELLCNKPDRHGNCRCLVPPETEAHKDSCPASKRPAILKLVEEVFEAGLHEQELLTRDCAMLLRMTLVAKDMDKLRAKIADYLKRKGLFGSILREEQP